MIGRSSTPYSKNLTPVSAYNDQRFRSPAIHPEDVRHALLYPCNSLDGSPLPGTTIVLRPLDYDPADVSWFGGDRQRPGNSEGSLMTLSDHMEEREQHADERHYSTTRRLFAELLGTFALTTVAAGGGVIAAINGGVPGDTSRVVAPALLVMAMIYSLGPISGAHFNPVVTLAFALRQDFPWLRVPGYVLMQCIGALLAAALLRILFGTAGHLGANLPHHGTLTSVVMEGILTFFLLTVILATAANAKIVGHNASIAVAATIALDGLFAGPISGASMNPARSLGPALVAGEPGDLWIYIIGPAAGALIAVGVAWLLRGGTNPSAQEAASGTE
ncbi:MAG: hypothetical protein NVSMB52_20000 [Chloroflexota bacterium]